MDSTTKKCLLQVIGEDDQAREIMHEMDVFEEDGYHPKQLLNRKRILWLHGKRICGRDLVTMYLVHQKDIAAMCETIDKKRRQAEIQNWKKAVQRLASDLSNDETPVKQRLLALSTCFESIKDLYDFLQLFTKMGFGPYFKESLQFSSPAEFVELTHSAYKKYSVREQQYRNACDCADMILNVRYLKTSSLTQLKKTIKDRLGPLEALHERAIILYNLIQLGWEGPLMQQVENFYNQPQQLVEWSEFLLTPPSRQHLCCYLLLCTTTVIQKLKVFLMVLNQ